MGIVTGSFTVVAVDNGISVYRSPVTVNGPLLQYYNTSGAITPDWSKTAADKQPVLYPYILHGANVMVPSSITWKYNGITLAFDATSGNCTTQGYATVFKTVSQTVAAGKTTPALKIIGNLASGNNTDDDLITCTGTVEVNGSQISFGEVRFPVTIQTGSGTMYKLFISANSFEVGNGKTATLTADVYINAQKQTASDYTFEFQKQDNSTVDGWADITSTGQTCVITADMVDGDVCIKCVARNKSGEIVASDIVRIVDTSDPYRLQIDGENSLNKGESTTLKAKLVKMATGEEVTGKGMKVSWKFTGNNDNVITTPTVSNDTLSATLTYDAVTAAGRAIHCYLEGTFTD